MQGITFKADYAAIYREFERSMDSYPQIVAAVDVMAKTLFQRCKDAMLKDFNDHPITEELKAGPEAENISNTLDGREGNLFSYLGFYFTDEPTKNLEMLLNNVSMRKSTRRGTTVYYTVAYPDKNDIEPLTRMDWGGGTSWAYAVENGDFNGDEHLSHYIYKTYLGGRSQQGIQVKGVYAESDFLPRPYISEIMGNFIERINGLKV
jgi:hypothetical protein